MARLWLPLLALIAAVTGLVLLTSPIPQSKAQSAPPVAAQQGTGPVVLELFTSQGCSSCPPADVLAARLARRSDVIVISRPVTYWDRLGWRDTLALPANTDLQRAYAARGLAGYSGVYTPQAVVDGQAGEIGSGRQEVEAMIAAASRRARPRLIVDREEKTVTVRGTGAGGARLALVGMSAQETVSIGRGENGDRTLNYTNVYRGARDLGAWRGGTQVFALGTPPNLPGADTYALVLRAGESGPILAAARL